MHDRSEERTIIPKVKVKPIYFENPSTQLARGSGMIENKLKEIQVKKKSNETIQTTQKKQDKNYMNILQNPTVLNKNKSAAFQIPSFDSTANLK